MDIVGTLITGVYTLLLILDGIVYNLVNYFYEIFLFLAKINIFSNNDYEEIVQSIYIVLGVIMLFILAYSLLKAIINPDSFAKGESSFPNLVKNILTSLIIIILLPTVFSVAFNIQNVFLNNNTIFKIILGDNSSTDTIEKSGGQMSYYTFRAFFHESEEWCTSDGNNYSVGTLRTDGSLSDDCKNFITNSDGEDLMTVDNQVYSGTRSFSAYSSFASAVNEGQIDYMFIISTLAGLFLAYVLLSFCFDLAVRVVKLAFYQTIAPIPVVCRILPGGKLKDTFSKWTKQVISLFLEVFIRIGVMCIGVLLLTKIIDNFSTIDFDLLDGFAQKQIVQALLIMGVVIFIRQCPKLIGELFGLDTGGMKLGIMDKLAMGGGLIAGAAAGGLATAGIRNFAGAFTGKGIAKDLKSRNFGSAFKKIGTSIVPGIKSGIAGAGSGAARAGFNARGAKNLRDMAGAAGKGAAAAGAAKAKRAAYKASHRNVSIAGHNFEVGKIPLVGGVIGSAAGHASDLVSGAAQWAGIDSMQALIDDNKIIDDINARKKGVRSAAEDLIIGESNKAGVDKSFGIAGMSTKHLRELRQNMEAAKGTARYAVAQDAYDSYLKSFVDGVQNQALLGTTSWDSLSIGDKADLGEVRIAAKNYRDILTANLTQRYVANSGFNASILDENQSLDVGSGPMKDIGDQLKIAKTENSMKINELRQKQENSGK